MSSQLLEKLNDKRVASLPEQRKLKDLKVHYYYRVHEFRRVTHEKFGASILAVLSDYMTGDHYSAYLPKRYARELDDDIIQMVNTTDTILLLWIEKHANSTSYLKFKWDPMRSDNQPLYSDEE